MAVVKKTLIIIEPGDVLNVVLRCAKCKREVVYSPDTAVPELRACSLCVPVTQWDGNNDGDKMQREMGIALFNALQYFWSDEYRRRRRDSESKWDITLVLPSDSD